MKIILNNIKEAIEKGAYDFIKKESESGKTVKRRYLSGGITPVPSNVDTVPLFVSDLVGTVKVSGSALSFIKKTALVLLATTSMAFADISDYDYLPGDTTTALNADMTFIESQNTSTIEAGQAYDRILAGAAVNYIDRVKKHAMSATDDVVYTDALGGLAFIESNLSWNAFIEIYENKLFTVVNSSLALIMDSYVMNMKNNNLYLDATTVITQMLNYADANNESDMMVRYYFIRAIGSLLTDENAAVIASLQDLQGREPESDTRDLIDQIIADAPSNTYIAEEGLRTQLPTEFNIEILRDYADNTIACTPEVQALAVKNLAITDVYSVQEDKDNLDFLNDLKDTENTPENVLDEIDEVIDILTARVDTSTSVLGFDQDLQLDAALVNAGVTFYPFQFKTSPMNGSFEIPGNAVVEIININGEKIVLRNLPQGLVTSEQLFRGLAKNIYFVRVWPKGQNGAPVKSLPMRN